MTTHEERATRALSDLEELVALGPRFHGTSGIHDAERLLVGWLVGMGARVRTQEVRTPGWDPGASSSLRVTAPLERAVPAWPMLWSGPATGVVRGRVHAVGVQGLWGDSMVWTKFAVTDADGALVAYLHARDGGPAAPQPLPAGSDTSVPHLALGHIDGLSLSEWLADGITVEVELACESAHAGEAVSRNVIVDVPAAGPQDRGRVLVSGHYDTFFNTPGAYDNGSGTIALVHLVRQLMTQPPSRPVTVVLTTAEEWHLAGSRHYVEQMTAKDGEELDFVLNVDGLGRGDFMEVFAGPETFEREFLAVLGAYAAENRPDLRVQSRFPPTCGTDQGAFYAAGLPVAFYTFNDLHRLHQPEDLPNPGIAANIAWSVPLLTHLVEVLPRADRVPSQSLSIPF
ncbi:M28 family metallopeptidase [Georgenia satyanarayanai]|uniref:M20/M25/M40 family metallo-hydrolase n=1 Tax=Georgenia satyanarayanai TaxID=860221 RepID=UPI00203BD753|nr:M20/M25/M40 family metallo-hydrolase [Georgenia satyanarayanai]MCM3659771.1 M28 family metallopeptidase [Georgenia satyanarayanai]